MKLLQISLFISLLSFFNIDLIAQDREDADMQFHKEAYKEAINSYKKIYKRGSDSYDVISRIADAYYFNSNVKKAVKWYSTLEKKYPQKMTDKHFFRFAHSLKGIGKYQDADNTIKKISYLKENDKLAMELLNTPDYYTKYKNKRYDILSFNNLKTNTKYSDFGAGVFSDNLYFASSKKGVYKDIYRWNEQAFLNLYKAKIVNTKKNTPEEKIKVQNTYLLSEPVRTKFHESNAAFSKDGKTMYFTRDNYYKGKKKKSGDKKVLLKLYKASLINGKWSNIKELPFNSNEYSVGHPALSKDQKNLFFVSNMKGGIGETDIYKVEIKGEDSYGIPINLGNTINTKGKEMFPFISEDNTLYFASDGHLGLGGLDVFESKITQNGEFKKIKNLQTPFNSGLDDFAFFIDSENKRGFISSNRIGGKGDDDIYSFILKHKKEQFDYDCKKIIGLTTNKKTGDILPNTTVGIYNQKGKLLNELKSDSNGNFSFPINCLSNTYKLRGNKEKFKESLKEINSDDIKEAEVLKLELDPIIAKVVAENATIRTIYFNFNKAGIREGDSRPELDEIINIMNTHPNLIIKIESHTDSRGSNKYNLKLSERRAYNTKKYFISKGIKASRIASAKGFGESKLVNNCSDNTKCTEEQHQLNRRSYFKIVKGGEGITIEEITPEIIDRKPGF